MVRNLALICLIPLLGGTVSLAQSTVDTRPVVGLRDQPIESRILQNARVVVAPGEVFQRASIAIEGSSIVAIGADIEISPGAELIDYSGKTIYAGLIDAYSEVNVDNPKDDGAGHWNGNVMPRRSATSALGTISDIAKLRGQGITMRLVAPKGGIVKGSSCLVLLDRNRPTIIARDIAQHVQLTVPRGDRRDDYPNSPMGATALLRQVLYDANWYQQAWSAYLSDRTIPRPVRNDDLKRLAEDGLYGRFVVDAQNERMAIRAHAVASEFSLNAMLRGSGREYRDVRSIAACNRPILVPVDFPDAPKVANESDSDRVDLRELMHWHFAPENPQRLVKAGATICLTTDGLDDPKDYLKNIRRAVKRGLDPDAALAAVTVNPAKLFGIESVAGTIHAGALANLVITSGDLFDQDTTIVESWVAGKRFEHDTDEELDSLAGNWTTKIPGASKPVSVTLELKQDEGKWSGSIQLFSPNTKAIKTSKAAKKEDGSAEKSEEESADEHRPSSAKLNEVNRSADRLSAWVDLSKASNQLPAGPSRLNIVTVEDAALISMFTTITTPDGKTHTVDLKPKGSSKPDDRASDSEDDDQQPDKVKENQDESDESKSDLLEDIVVNYPLGGFGVTDENLSGESDSAACVLFRGAKLWTCADDGILERADILVIDGKIHQIADSISPPKQCKIIDARGKHITPGLIDCHSHMGTDGGVNESGQAVTAEARIGDFIDNSDINIYRQLAGGLTIANILHGSANPIGGQNQVIKLRWGRSMRDMKFAAAPGGIKFALGENVKRSNWSEPQTRYPASRMGVEQIMRDRFLAAREYARQHDRYRRGLREGLPPRIDLELEALAEILDGKRWIHCHSYRQDEIVTLLDLLDQFNVTIGTLQHILEGYKVADRMKAHGAMASAFSDWWAYKFEVYDAIPDNGAIMHDLGIIVSFNSDDRELARHMNTEAAKAIKYGGVPAEEALKFVTLNPAKQLRIDDRVGSLEVGKDADLVLWNGPPMSTLSKCEQTWIDGQLMFSIEQDQQLRQRDHRWRSLIIGRILDKGFAFASDGEKEVEEEDRWLRYDEFCHAHDHDDHEHDDDHGEHQ